MISWVMVVGLGAGDDEVGVKSGGWLDLVAVVTVGDDGTVTAEVGDGGG